MPITMENIRLADAAGDQRGARSAMEAKQQGKATAFLCHSHQDRGHVLGVVNLLTKAGWRVYVDWMDQSMPTKPNRDTATKIKDRIRQLDYFLFLATSNSMNSKWCPWEIGYADTHKFPEKLLVIPTNERGTTHGNEYLDLYRRIDVRPDGLLGAIDPGSEYGTLLRDLR